MQLAAEAGEVNGKIGKIVRKRGVAKFSHDEKEALAKELGDVLWYVAMLSKELGYTLNAVAAMNIDKLKSRAERDMLHGDGDDR
jgi:NTP pyrophosphatase (non-canonical NTP hydrolase)